MPWSAGGKICLRPETGQAGFSTVTKPASIATRSETKSSKSPTALFALSVLVFTDAFITDLVIAGEIFKGNKIVGRPMRTVRAKVPSITA